MKKIIIENCTRNQEVFQKSQVMFWAYPGLGWGEGKSGAMKAGDGDGWKNRKLSVAGEKLLSNFETRITFNLQ